MSKERMKKGLSLVFGGTAALETDKQNDQPASSPQDPKSAVETKPPVEDQESESTQSSETKPVALKTKQKKVTTKRTTTKKKSSGAPAKTKITPPTAETVAIAQDNKKERIQPFSLQMPESMHNRLKYYVDNFARRHESMTKIILDGLDMNLTELEKRAGIAE